jgi:hypothetical protein
MSAEELPGPASGFDAASPAAPAIRTAGYPPDVLSGGLSLWFVYWNAFWEVTICQWQKKLDPGSEFFESTLLERRITASRRAHLQFVHASAPDLGAETLGKRRSSISKDHRLPQD